MERRVGSGDVVVTPPNTTHYVIPDAETVLVAISTPPFMPESYIPVMETDPLVGFDRAQLKRLTSEPKCDATEAAAAEQGQQSW